MSRNAFAAILLMSLAAIFIFAYLSEVPKSRDVTAETSMAQPQPVFKIQTPELSAPTPQPTAVLPIIEPEIAPQEGVSPEDDTAEQVNEWLEQAQTDISTLGTIVTIFIIAALIYLILRWAFSKAV
jgi:hypothetical protein